MCVYHSWNCLEFQITNGTNTSPPERSAPFPKRQSASLTISASEVYASLRRF